jgi:hypothetical protein
VPVAQLVGYSVVYHRHDYYSGEKSGVVNIFPKKKTLSVKFFFVVGRPLHAQRVASP